MSILVSCGYDSASDYEEICAEYLKLLFEAVNSIHLEDINFIALKRCLTAISFVFNTNKVNQVTPFLIRNVISLLAAVRNNDFVSMASLAAETCIQIIDCFFKEFSTGFLVTLEQIISPSSLIFPSLGIKTDLEGSTVQLVIRGSHHLLINSKNYEITFPPNILVYSLKDEDNFVNAMILSNGDSWPLKNKESLDIEQNRDQVMALNVLLQKSYNIIKEVDFQRYSNIVRLIKWYVPLANLNDRVHRSRSIDTFVGTIFISNYDSLLPILEAIIHEYSHNELNAYLIKNQLIKDNSPQDFYYSPWRIDPRPLLGLIHGIYVFSEVVSFYFNVLSLNKTLFDVETIKKIKTIYAYRVKQVIIGLDQIPDSLLTKKGHELINKIKASMHDYYARIKNNAGFNQPEILLEHAKSWMEVNVKYRDKIILQNSLSSLC